MKSLKATHNLLSESEEQLNLLNNADEKILALPKFYKKLKDNNQFPLLSNSPEILQVNVGKMCNQVCKHCHVDAGPDRKEIMTRETMQQCIDVLAANPSLTTVDLTGGATEMTPEARWLVEENRKTKPHEKISVGWKHTITEEK